jgi:hypothetical protein
MKEEGDAKDLLNKAMDLDLSLVIVLGVREEEGSVVLHNLENDLHAGFLIKTFLATLEMSILEDLYERGKSKLN